MIPLVSTSIDPANGNLLISWSAPNSNGDPISSYTIQILKYGDVNYYSTSSCDGTTAAVLSSLSCEITMSTLTSATFAYTFGTTVLVRVASTNSGGTSDYAYNLGGATVRSIPNQMNDPVVTSYSDTFINLSWTALTGTATGNSDITAYDLYWNAGVGTTPSTLVTEALITSYHFTSITGGATYYF